MIHVGADLHQRFCYFTALDARGRQLRAGAVVNEAEALRQWLRQLPGQVQVAVEACSFWPGFREAIESEVAHLRLVHPQRVKAIAAAKLKNDKVDSATLAHLLRCDLLPEAWMADAATRELRQQVRLRATLVRQRTRLKNQVHAILHQQGLRSAVSDVFGVRGRQWLTQLKLPTAARVAVDTYCGLIDHFSQQIATQDRALRQQVKRDQRARWLTTIPGIGQFSALLCRQARAVQLRRTGAVGARIGRPQKGPRFHHPLRFHLAALDHGRSGLHRGAHLAGGARLVSAAGAAQAQARGPRRAGPQAAGRGLGHAQTRGGFRRSGLCGDVRELRQLVVIPVLRGRRSEGAAEPDTPYVPRARIEACPHRSQTTLWTGAPVFIEG